MREGTVHTVPFLHIVAVVLLLAGVIFVFYFVGAT